MPFGAAPQPGGGVRFRLWAPAHASVNLVLDDEDDARPMTPQAEGWHEILAEGAGPGTRYRFALTDGMRVPDPASRFQPEDVHGPSEVIDPAAYRWSDGDWRGRPWHETVLYELHVGTFTPEGTYRAVIDRLDHLVGLGVTAIELLPVAEFPGRRNWGYDGVLPYAPDSAYGRPEDLKALVDAAHGRGLMVFLDVVYNHFGPEGNYFPACAPQLFTDRHKTPWGSAINYDGPDSRPVRDYFVHNALYWIEEFHLDGLRLDAVHAIVDDSPTHILEELADRVHALARAEQRHVHLVLENADNIARYLARDPDGRPRWHTAQWNDDVHHGLHTAATGESAGYYADYAGDLGKLGRSLAEGFAFQGEPSSAMDGRPRGEPSGHLPPTAFVSFLQNHDQIGNRAFGERITDIAPSEAVRTVACLYLLAPQVPMLFMGEEWGAAQPFPFFCDFGPELAEAVRQGRREEFAKFPEFQDPALRERIPDPTAEQTFASARLAWEDAGRAPHAGWLDWYRRVLAVRRAEIVPRLAEAPGRSGRYAPVGETGLRVSWTLGDGSTLAVQANLAAAPLAEIEPAEGREIWREGTPGPEGAGLGPWSVVWTLREPSGLDRLARRMGIEEEYGSAAGGVVRASDETKRALLAAMGVEVAGAAAAERRLAELDRAEWARPLPPVVVAREDRLPLTVGLALPAGTGEVRWSLAEEDGRRREGTVRFEDLESQREGLLDDRPMARRRLVVEGPLPLGYHRLRVEADGTAAETPVIVTPRRCHLPAALEEGPGLWGIATQLYAVRSAPDWGIGDFGDLRNLLGIAAKLGAGVVGLNPLHAMFLDRPDHASPYSPASRLFLNVLYIDVTAIPELMTCDEALRTVAGAPFRDALAAAAAEPMVDHEAVLRLKLPVLERLHAAFRDGAAPERQAAFAAFRRAQGEALERFCRFQALREHFAGTDPQLADWRRWPEPYRDAGSAAVARFADEHAARIDFLAWLQWIADDQLAAAAAQAQAHGMPVGLYRDLAVGADSGGAETWASPRLVVAGARVGAPPDIFNPAGQDWGLPPFDPHALREEAYAGFIALLRANMRHAGGLRIDHVMALQHLYWIPEGLKPSEGAYVAYPLDEMVGILALESRRHRCLVVGEDLGTVPPGFRERMAEAGILSYRVVFFEWRADGSFVGPDDYPRLALATIGSHDLATLRGWWEGRDIGLKADLGLYPDPDEAGRQQERRARDKAALVEALAAAGLPLPEGFDANSPYDDALSDAAHAFLARTRSSIAMVQLEDLTGQADQVNLPGTTTEHPNWRRKLPLTLEEIAEDARVRALAGVLAEARPAAGEARHGR